jgi:hypothetical protein
MSNIFLFGEYVDIGSVVESILSVDHPVLESQNICKNGHVQKDARVRTINCYHIIRDPEIPVASIAVLMADSRTSIHRRCATCNDTMQRRSQFIEIPNIMAIETNKARVRSIPVINIETQLTVAGRLYQYNIKGIIYYGQDHFTSIFIDEINDAWYHDGIVTGQNLVNIGPVTDLQDLTENAGRKAVAIIYCKAE